MVGRLLSFWEGDMLVSGRVAGSPFRTTVYCKRLGSSTGNLDIRSDNKSLHLQNKYHVGIYWVGYIPFVKGSNRGVG